MQHDELLAELRQLETSLHKTSVRSSVPRLEELLHDQFFEFGRSGGSFDKAQVLQSLPAEQPTSTIQSQNYELDLLTDDIALLRYQSYQLNDAGECERITNRSSLWQRVGADWQLRFHQGTPTSAVAKRVVFDAGSI